MSCLTNEQIVSLALGEAGDSFREHVAGCQGCADRLAEAEARMALLADALAAPDPAHEAGRARLLAALEAEPIPIRSLFWRIVMNRRNWAVTAAAAMIATVIFLGWPGGPRAVALAEALRPFKEAKSFACDMINLKGSKPWDAALPAEKRNKLKTRLTWAAPGSLRLDTNYECKTTLILPHGKEGVLIDHATTEYTPIPRKPDGKEDMMVKLVNALVAYTPGEKRPDGIDEIDGLKAPRFDLMITDAEKREWHYRIWVHPTTKRPLRVEFALLPGKEVTGTDVDAARLVQFEWDVKTEGLFDTKPPAGYNRVVVNPDERTEMMTQKIVAALKVYCAATGGYPTEEPFDGPKAARELEKRVKKKLDVDAAQGFMLVRVLQAASKDTVYHGKTVGPENKDKVLFRWKLNDGRYRVIFGNLKAETVSGERLKELEGSK
jgi:hypothetical protein